MATKKSNVKNTENQKAIENVEQKNNKPVINEQPQRKVRQQIDLNAMILCRSVVSGGLTYISPKTQLMIRWNDYGDVEYVPFGEIATMNAAKRKFLYEPWIIIEDEEVIEYFGLDKVYSKLVDIDNIENFFTRPLDEIKEKIRMIPSGMKDLIASKARKMMQDGTLYDIRIIKLLEQELKIDLQILLE